MYVGISALPIAGIPRCVIKKGSKKKTLSQARQLTFVMPRPVVRTTPGMMFLSGATPTPHWIQSDGNITEPFPSAPHVCQKRWLLWSVKTHFPTRTLLIQPGEDTTNCHTTSSKDSGKLFPYRDCSCKLCLIFVPSCYFTVTRSLFFFIHSTFCLPLCRNACRRCS